MTNTKSLLVFMTTTFMATICHRGEALGLMKIFSRKSGGYNQRIEVISSLEMQSSAAVIVNKVDTDGIEKIFFPPYPYPSATESKPATSVVRASPKPSPKPTLIPVYRANSTSSASPGLNEDRPKLLAALLTAAVCLVAGGSQAIVGPLRMLMNAVAASLYGFVWWKTLRSYVKGDDTKASIGAGETKTNPSGRDMLMSF